MYGPVSNLHLFLNWWFLAVFTSSEWPELGTCLLMGAGAGGHSWLLWGTISEGRGRGGTILLSAHDLHCVEVKFTNWFSVGIVLSNHPRSNWFYCSSFSSVNVGEFRCCAVTSQNCKCQVNDSPNIISRQSCFQKYICTITRVPEFWD